MHLAPASVHSDGSAAPWAVRRRWLRAFRRLVAQQGAELARLVALEVGKDEGEAFVSEVLPLLAAIRWHERHASRILRGRVAPGRPAWLLGRSLRTARAPIGHVLVIATWNYPVGLLGVQLVQAIVAGNRVTVKPSERSARSQRMLVRLAASSGLPEGCLSLADASREEGERLVRSGAFDHVIFTGSSETGRQVASVAADSLTSTTLELSGRDSAIVLADADAALAARRLWLALTLNGGQTCMAPRRVLVDRRAYRRFIEALAPLAAAARPVRLAMATEASRCVALARDAMQRGARSLSGVAEAASDGWIRPLAIVDCPAEVELTGGAHFGPVFAVVPVDGLEHALRVHAQHGHRLATSVYTRSARRLSRDAAFIEALGSSVVTFNETITPTGHPAATIAGHGASGWGATRGEAGLLGLTRSVTVGATAWWTPMPVPPAGSALRWMMRAVSWLHGARRAPRLSAVATTRSNGTQVPVAMAAEKGSE